MNKEDINNLARILNQNSMINSIAIKGHGNTKNRTMISKIFSRYEVAQMSQCIDCVEKIFYSKGANSYYMYVPTKAMKIIDEYKNKLNLRKSLEVNLSEKSMKAIKSKI